jgi:phosphoribosylformimino-5-aminoimidazole carboxamide ribotide isomerase
MEIIPVIDIMNGLVVHGKSGNRYEYKPLNSILCPTSNPHDVINKYEENGAEKVYIADLNAIMGNGNNFEIIKSLPSYKIVDAGIVLKKDAEHVEKLKICDKIIVGTETLKDLSLLSNENIILSLDFKYGNILNNFNYELETLLGHVNFNTPLIILDISAVGTRKGINVPLIKKIMNIVNNPIYIGGGIKNEGDLKKSYDLGVDGVLIATAIHNGALNLKTIIEKYGK